ARVVSANAAAATRSTAAPSATQEVTCCMTASPAAFSGAVITLPSVPSGSEMTLGTLATTLHPSLIGLGTSGSDGILSHTFAAAGAVPTNPEVAHSPTASAAARASRRLRRIVGLMRPRERVQEAG